MSGSLLRAQLWVLPILVTACAPLDRSAERAFLRGDDGAALEAFAARAAETDADYALEESLYGTASLVAGDYRTARRALVDAGRIMGSFPETGGRELAAIIGLESTKLYLGDPYEAAMNALYTAFIFLERGDIDNARAALKAGILSDSSTEGVEYTSDVTALYLLEAFLLMQVGKEELAQKDIEHVLGIEPDNPFADPDVLANANTLLLIDTGTGPRKVARGKFGELATFDDPGGPESEVELSLGGAPLAAPIVGVDLAYQALTRGGRAMDGILRGKAVFKDVSGTAGVVLLDQALRKGYSKKQRQALAAIGGALVFLSALIQPRADTRHCHVLPARTYLWIGRVEPGLHSLQLDFRDESGRFLPHYRQVWHYLPFRDGTLNVYYFRSGYHKGYRRGNRDGYENAPVSGRESGDGAPQPSRDDGENRDAAGNRSPEKPVQEGEGTTHEKRL